MDDETPQAEIAACRAAHARVHERVAEVDDATLRRPSLLPGWTVGHVLAPVGVTSRTAQERSLR